MIPSMSRPANPYDNASRESFLKTLKREEIYAHAYRDLTFTCAPTSRPSLDQYYNRIRLHSAAGVSTAGRVRAHRGGWHTVRRGDARGFSRDLLTSWNGTGEGATSHGTNHVC
jgi:transposase InsO family protein